MILGFILLGLSFGQSSGALSSNFHPRHRYTGSAFTSDLAWLFGAGFAPMVALWLSSAFGLLAAGAYLLSGAVGTLVALWLNRELARNIDCPTRWNFPSRRYLSEPWPSSSPPISPIPAPPGAGARRRRKPDEQR